MEIILFKDFSKRENSTKVPTDSTGEKRNVVLKENTDILNPTFLLSNVDFAVNFVKWNNRYYKVTNITVNSMGMYELSCKVDVLASWKSSILATTAYVEYSSSDYNVNIRDSRLSATANKTMYESIVPLGNLYFSRAGCYILKVISASTNGVNGASSVFALTSNMMKQFSEVITAQSFLDTLRVQFTNPLECVVGCHWLPFSYESVSGTETEIKLAYNGTGVTAKMLTTFIDGNEVTVNIPTTSTEKNFTDLSPYSTGILYLPFVGCVPLDLDAYYPRDTIQIKITVDYATGAISYRVGADVENGYIATYNGKCSTELPLSASNYDAMGMVGGAVALIGGIAGTIATVATGGSAGAVIAGVGTTIGGAGMAVNSASVHTQTNGSLSSRIGAWTGLDIVATVIKSELPQAYNNTERIARIGLPCNKVRSLSGLSGYVKTSGAGVNANALPLEKEEINSLLDSGIYIE